MKNNYKAVLIVAMAMVLITTTAFAEINIRFWKAPHGEDEKIFGKLIESFEKENPEIKIEHLVTPWQGWDEQYGSAFSGGNPPDISYMPDEFYPRFAESGYLLSLSDCWPDEIDSIGKNYPESNWKKGAYKGAQYGIPTLTAPFLTFVNTKLLSEIGIEKPTTWEEFEQAIIKFSSVTKYGWGMTTRANDNPQNSWYNFLFQAGADLLNKDGTAVGWDNEAGITAINYVVKLAKLNETPSPSEYNNSQLDELFLSGELAMKTNGPDFNRVIKREKPDLQYCILEPLLGPGGEDRRLIWAPTGNWVISKSCEHKEEAWKFIKFLIKNEEYYANGLAMLPAQSGIDAFPDIPEMKIYSQLSDRFYQTPIHPKLRSTHSLLNSELEAACLGMKTPEQAVKDAAERINNLLAK